MNYTKTQWIISKEDKRFVYALNEEGTNTFTCLVQNGGSNKTPKEEIEGNAILISFAPEMLETIESLLEYTKKDPKYNAITNTLQAQMNRINNKFD